jgi:peroxiredoxin
LIFALKQQLKKKIFTLTKQPNPCKFEVSSLVAQRSPMVRTASTMLPLGVTAPDFNLPDVVSGQNISLASFANKKGLLVMFISVHCPFVKHIQAELALLGHNYQDQGLGIVAISSNDAEKYPDDAPDSLKAMAESADISYPICYDADQSIAKVYSAACTPDFFLFDQNLQLAYRGQLDDSRPSNGKPVTGKDLRAAISLVLAGESVDTNQRPSIGCNIKWIPGNEPEYFTGVRAEED